MTRKSPVIWILIVVLAGACTRENRSGLARRGFDEARIAKLNASERYNYDRVIEPSSNKVVEFVAHVFSFIASLLNATLGYVAIILLLILLIWLISHSSWIKTTRKIENDPAIRYVDEHHLDDLDLDQLLNDALSNKNYHLAIRFSFLMILKQLKDLELIKIEQGKTNHQYLAELPKSTQAVLRPMVAIYEYIWYGHFQATKRVFDQFSGWRKELEMKIRKS